MFPFRDHNPSSTVPFVTYGLIAINVLVFLYDLTLPNKGIFYANYALIPAWVADGHHLSGFLTSMFLHGGPAHLIGNMLFLWIFGDNIEDTLGHVKFLGFYLLTGVAAALLHVVLNLNSNVPLIGASGAIAGVMGAYWLLFPRARVDVFFMIRVFSIPAFIVLTIWLGMQVFFGFSTTSGGGGVAYWAHFGGFVAGVLLIIPVCKRNGAKLFWQKNDYMPPHPATKVRELGVFPKIKRR